MCLIQHMKAVTYQPPLKTSDSSVVLNFGITTEIINPIFYNYKVVAEKSCRLHITNHAHSQTLSSFPLF